MTTKDMLLSLSTIRRNLYNYAALSLLDETKMALLYQAADNVQLVINSLTEVELLEIKEWQKANKSIWDGFNFNAEITEEV